MEINMKTYIPPITSHRDFLIEVVFYSASPLDEIKTPTEEYADESENYTKPRDNYSNYDLWNLNE